MNIQDNLGHRIDIPVKHLIAISALLVYDSRTSFRYGGRVPRLCRLPFCFYQLSFHSSHGSVHVH